MSKTIYICWTKNIELPFRSDYEKLTGECISKPTRQNMPETHNLVGSGRILKEHMKILSEKYPDVTFSNSIPDDWQDYLPPELKEKNKIN